MFIFIVICLSFLADNVVVGPNSLLHACTIQGRNVVGAGTQVLDGAVLEMDTVITAGALVGPGKLVPSGQVCVFLGFMRL